MKKFSKILYALAALPLMLASCVEEVVREPGQKDLENCYGVYFKELDKASQNLELDPSAKTEVTLTALRPNSEDIENLPAITVPVEVTSPKSASGLSVFELSEIKFEEGQISTDFTVSFPEAELGKACKCVIEITDPQYASVYSQNPTVLSFTVTRVKWNLVTGEGGEKEGLYRDDVFSTLFKVQQKNAEGKIEIYERQDKKGYFRISNLYSKLLMSKLFGGSPDEYTQNLYPADVYIDATDPAKVKWVLGEIGVDLGLGKTQVASFSHEYLQIEPSQSLYGTFKEGIIRFPVNGLVYADKDGAFQTNGGGMARIILPGFKDVDYALGVMAGLSDKGKMPVRVVKGADVATAKYAVVSGAVKPNEYRAYAGKISRGELESKVVDQSDFTISLEKTGVYSIIVAGFDGETLVASAGCNISYVAAGDEVPVVVNAGLIVSDKYAALGYTSENSAEAYLYGKDLAVVHAMLAKKSDFVADQEGVVRQLLQSEPMTKEDLALVNGDGWSQLVGKLQAGTEYVFLAYASNGYEEKLIMAEARTEGKPDPIHMLYDVNSLHPAKAKADFYKNNWALHYYDAEKAGRSYVGDVALSDGGVQGEGEEQMDLVNMQGLWTPIMTANDIVLEKDITAWDCYEGVLYSIAPQAYGKIAFQGQELYPFLANAYGNDQAGFGNGAYIGAFTEAGDIAFIDSGAAAQLGGCVGIGLFAFADEQMTQAAGALIWINDFLLVNPENMAEKQEVRNAASAKTMNLLSQVRMNLVSVDNCVENYQTQVRKAIDKALSIKTYQAGSFTGIRVEREAVPVDFTVSPASGNDVFSAKKCPVTLR